MFYLGPLGVGPGTEGWLGASGTEQACEVKRAWPGSAWGWMHIPACMNLWKLILQESLKVIVTPFHTHKESKRAFQEGTEYQEHSLRGRARWLNCFHHNPMRGFVPFCVEGR